VKKAVETGKRGNGTPLSDDDKRTYSEAIPEIEQHLPDMAALRYEPPTMAFDKEMTIWLGKREVRVLFLGRANTGGDALVYVPDAKTIITGDLLVYPTPYGIGSFIGDWAKTMDKLMAIDAVNIVPGHGPVMHDWSYAKQVQALLAATLDQTRTAAAGGATLDDVRKKVDLTSFRKQFAGTSERKNRYFHDYYEVPAVGRAYQEVKGTLTEEEQ
jgi:cyclase